MKWGSAVTDGRDGFNDAAVVEFATKSNIVEVVVRELVQNSLDAVANNSLPVEVSFEVGEVESKNIPDWQGLVEIFKLSQKFNQSAWPGAFKILEDQFSQDTINYLKVIDSNTLGLSSQSTGDNVSSWEACVLADNQSVRKNAETARGSFGIGKNAAFALSAMNTVLYSSKSDNEMLFGGVAKFGGHSKNGINYASKKILKGEEINSFFHRSTDANGLTQSILGIDENVMSKIFILLELYIYKHYIIALFEKKLKISIIFKHCNVEVINKGNNSEFTSFVTERLLKLESKCKLKSQLEEISRIRLVLNAISAKAISIEGVYEKLKKELTLQSFVDRENVPSEWDFFFKNTRLFIFKDSGTSKNTIYHFRNGMFIESKPFNNSLTSPITIVHNVDSALNKMYSAFETFSHDSWKKSLLRQRISETEDIKRHQELFEFQKLLPKFLLIELEGDKILDGESVIEDLVNSILFGQDHGLQNSKNGLFSTSMGGVLVTTKLVANGMEVKNNGSQGGANTGNRRKRNGDNGTKEDVKKNKSNSRSFIKPIISSGINSQSQREYNFVFNSIECGKYGFCRQGYVQLCDLQHYSSEVNSSNASILIEGEVLILNITESSNLTLRITVRDTVLTQWKISKF